MEKIKIITDSTSDVSKDFANEYDVCVLGQTIRFGEECFVETEEMSPRQFWDKLNSFGDIPKTSQINVTKFVDTFTEFKDSKIIYIGISSSASGTIQSANLARNMVIEENPDADITIIDSKTFTYAYGIWVMEAAKMAKEGKSKEEIIETVEAGIAKSEVLFVVDDLNYLEKGGRISPAAKMLGNVLDIKPILSVVDGLVMNIGKVRGAKKVYSKLVDMMIENADEIENQTIYILHGDDEEKMTKMKETIESKVTPKEIKELLIGGTIGTNAGPGVVAIVYIKK